MGILTILLLVLLAAGMDALDFKKGTPFRFTEIEETNNIQSIEPPDWTPAIIITLVIIISVTIFLLIVATPKQRRILIIILFAMTLVLLGLMWWISTSEPVEESFQPTATVAHISQDSSDPTLGSENSQPTVVYTPPTISPWISIGIAFFSLLVVAGIAWFFLRHHRRDGIPLDSLAGIAEQTISDLESGKDYGDSVIDCYAKMIRAVNKQRGIRRSGNLTPEEFIYVLERARLPSGPVRRLTALFTRVRYGGKAATKREIDEAIHCLTDIVSSIREAQ